ncbi:MAG: biotin--[acetyl-CoA-carboxylase] ligase [Faecalibacterium sp.]|nr:biotin--[acetyl-CoA-carboxylase] ligase [Faecalibacterium sp.]
MTTRQQLLEALRTQPDCFCSGQALADRLGISRAAVHKAATALQAQGWQIEAVPRKGYRLGSGADVLSAEALGPWPAPALFYDTIDSTNAAAKALAADAARAPHGTLLVAAQQTAGSGRRGRQFISPVGGVYFTLLLRPAHTAADSLSITCSAAVAVCRAVEKLCGISLSIKWVNDLYYQGKKVCGILTEAAANLDTGLLEWVAVGIGLNLAVPQAAFGPALCQTAGSLYPAGACPVSRAALAGEIARQLLASCPAFDDLAEYRARCFVPGHWVTVVGAEGTFSARAVSIDDIGRLVVETSAGRCLALRHEEVSIRPVLL